MPSIADGFLPDLCTITSYAASGGWSAPSTSGTQSNIPCRAERTAKLITLPDGTQITAQVKLMLGSSGTMAVGDTVAITGDSTAYRVLDVGTSRDRAGAVVARFGWLA